jgi:peptide deformylase
MRKKLLQLSSRKTTIQPKPIITFDDRDHGQSLLEPVARKLCNKEASARHAAILRASAAEAGSVCLANSQIEQEQRMIALHRHPLPNSTHPTSPHSMHWLSLQYTNSQDYEVFTDPEILSGQQLIEQQEESISFPLFHFTVKRYNSIAVRFRNQQNVREER